MSQLLKSINNDKKMGTKDKKNKSRRHKGRMGSRKESGRI